VCSNRAGGNTKYFLQLILHALIAKYPHTDLQHILGGENYKHKNQYTLELQKLLQIIYFKYWHFGVIPITFQFEKSVFNF